MEDDELPKLGSADIIMGANEKRDCCRRREADDNCAAVGLTVRDKGDGEVDGEGPFDEIDTTAMADEFMAFAYKPSISETDSIESLSKNR